MVTNGMSVRSAASGPAASSRCAGGGLVGLALRRERELCRQFQLAAQTREVDAGRSDKSGDHVTFLPAPHRHVAAGPTWRCCVRRAGALGRGAPRRPGRSRSGWWPGRRWSSWPPSSGRSWPSWRQPSSAVALAATAFLAAVAFVAVAFLAGGLLGRGRPSWRWPSWPGAFLAAVALLSVALAAVVFLAAVDLVAAARVVVAFLAGAALAVVFLATVVALRRPGPSWPRTRSPSSWRASTWRRPGRGLAVAGLSAALGGSRAIRRPGGWWP